MKRHDRAGYVVWEDALAAPAGRIEVRFVGRGPSHEASRGEVLRAVETNPPALAWARQIHSSRVLEAVPGRCGEGDALVTREAGLALSVITADCVPVLLAAADGGEIAAVHAGWRGLESDVVGTALERWESEAGGAVAWIGPAIGPCCYEVGHEVAERVAEATTEAAVLPEAGRDGRPHLDLPRATAHQLTRRGVTDVRVLGVCTHCNPEILYSYRRNGRLAGRDVGLIWRAAAGAP